MKLSSRKNEILDCAQELIQKRGYNGFSYADIACIVGIRKASIHHHFPAKSDLAVAVIRRYRETFNTSLLELTSKKKDWITKIHGYAKLYEIVLHEDKLCLCGMLASDIETLPSMLKIEIQQFFSDNVDWLSTVLTSGYPLFPRERLRNIAWHIITSLQGGVMMARMLGDSELFSLASQELFFQLEHLT